MFVVFKNSIAVMAFESQVDAVEYWRRHNCTTIILYPDLDAEDVCIKVMRRSA